MLKILALTTVFTAFVLGDTVPRSGIKGNFVHSTRTNKKQTFPYQISLAFYDEHYETYSHWCIGSIISNKWFVTAGSCFDKRQWSNKNATLVVIAGSAELGNKAGRSFHAINETIYNWWYFMNDFGVAVNDINLISVTKPFEFGPELQPVPLYDQDEEITDSNGIVSGWGSVEQFRDTKSLNVSIISKYECNILIHGALTYTGQICAVYHKQAHEKSCPIQSEPGSPLTINGRLAGILSWGTSPCAAPDEPSIYTEIGYFRNWIRNNTGV